MKKHLIVVMLVMCSILGITLIPLNSSRKPMSVIPLNATASTNPGNPDIITVDTSLLDGYGAEGVSFYYATFALTGSYGVVWLRPLSGTDNHDLYVYSDSGYTTLLDSSTLGAGSLEWVIIKKGAESNWYPRVYVFVGSAGSAYIEYDADTYCARGAVQTNDHISSSDAAELYSFWLDATQLYDFFLTVPATGDYGLYLYYMESSTTADTTEYLNKSTTSGNGVDEAIANFAPALSGTYLALVVWANGSGTFQFAFNYAGATEPPIPAFGLLAACIGLVLTVVMLLRRKRELVWI